MKPANREATIKHLKLSRAREEIDRLNVEARRLRTSIEDESERVGRVSELLKEQGLERLSAELRRRWKWRSEINRVHLKILDRLELCPYFTGKRGSGKYTEESIGGDYVDTADEIEDESTWQQDFEVVANFVLGIND